MSWENLEDLMTQLLMLDKAMTVPGSGNGKGEEDVIGMSTITQCKYSETKNVTILRKDIDRLLEAAELQQKIPIFVTENNGLKLISIPESSIFKDILHMMVGMSLMRFVQANAFKPSTVEERNEYRKLIKRSRKIMQAIDGKYDDIRLELNDELLKEDAEKQWLKRNQMDLFEEDTDEK